MSVRLSALVLGVVALLATAALTYAADKQITSTPRATPQVKAVPLTLVVPDVTRQAYVFAKGILVDAGFAWKLQGGAPGFSANTVLSQRPAPGTRVLDTGAPTIMLTLSRNGKYGQKGTPEDASPYAGTPLRLADTASQTVLPAAATPAAKPKPVAKPAAKPAAAAKSATPAAAKLPQSRPPAFSVPGAPKEPLDEIPLADRAAQLGVWIEKHPKPSDANVKHWLFQHEWIVQGAKFGWWQGADALQQLIKDDRRAEALWGIGAKSERVARAALAEVEARKNLIQRLRGQAGYSLVEMLTVLVILGTVIGGLTTLFEQGSNAEIDMNYRFQAQQDARIALDRMRRDLHCASAATSSSSTSVTFADACATGAQVSWCVATLNGRQGLFRQTGATACSTSSQRFADYVSTGSTYFAYQGSNTSSLAKLFVCVPVNVKPKRTVDTYALQDAIVLRNSTRTGSASTVTQPSCP